ncbi:flagellar basal body rod protein FlgC [Pseudoprimorskyibacter insulae]|uniref:Flagellar basal-body rod protein FlgC n=1 Tax=Pseudoprimorskyibacter insulae TaxID=1695997 RepID=A0A2R8AYW0_9RHOB|nr:flagellar basal body rod protein FlgC [Pseudoprimorskyibacter insulae]SPF81212.1 Flagellar basal-body rod protein FlgC [Pseudoprimorskyibacter insulae]
MSVFSDAMSVSASGLRVQAGRLNNVSQNIANTDTPGYRRKMTKFEAGDAAGIVQLGRTQLDPSELEKVFDPGHPMADATGHYEGSNVDMIVEIADAREAQRSYEANLKVFEQIRAMSDGLMDLLRR